MLKIEISAWTTCPTCGAPTRYWTRWYHMNPNGAWFQTKYYDQYYPHT